MRFVLVFALACVRPGPAVTAPAAFTVFVGEDAVLAVRSEPGPLTSTAPPPPGGQPVLHPFLSAAALDAAEESRLRTLLEASTSVEDFILRLKAAGYRVEPR